LTGKYICTNLRASLLFPTAIAMKQPILLPIPSKGQRLVCLPGGTAKSPAGIESYARITAAQRHDDMPQQRLQSRLKHLKVQSDRVNELATELENAIAELKEIATQVNQINHHLQKQGQNRHFPAQICDYRPTSLPVVRQSSWGRWILTSRRVDLYKAEREATVLAQILRDRRK
jgi:hypothetical protein